MWFADIQGPVLGLLFGNKKIFASNCSYHLPTALTLIHMLVWNCHCSPRSPWPWWQIRCQLPRWMVWLTHDCDPSLCIAISIVHIFRARQLSLAEFCRRGYETESSGAVDVAWLEGCLPNNVPECLDPVPSTSESATLVWTCNANIHKTDAGRSDAKGHPWLHKEFEASLD